MKYTFSVKFQRILIILAIVFCIFVSILLFFLLYFLFSNILANDSKERISKRYQLLELDPHRNQTRVGFVSILDDIREDDYISYRNEQTGSYVFIQNFGGDKYECTGSCHCEEDENSSFGRRATGVIAQGLILFLTSLSVMTAMKMAEESFRNNCVEDYSGICDVTNIRSGVTECVNIDDLERVDSEEGDEQSNELEGTDMEYECHGFCLTNGRIRVVEGYKAIEDFGDCQKLSLTREVKVFCSVEITARECNQLARQEFVSQKLKNFCRKQSVVNYEVFLRMSDGYGRNVKRNAAACVAKGQYLMNNVHCYMMQYDW